MGLFKNIFKKKPGGTFLGNIIRQGSNLIPGVGAAYNSINPPPPRVVTAVGAGPDFNPAAYAPAAPSVDLKVDFLGMQVAPWIPKAALGAGIFAAYYFFIRPGARKGKKFRL